MLLTFLLVFNCSYLVTVFFSLPPHFCPQDTTWTSVQHNGSHLARVKISDGEGARPVVFKYTASMDQLQAIIDRADHCQQELAFHCKKSRLSARHGE